MSSLKSAGSDDVDRIEVMFLCCGFVRLLMKSEHVVVMNSRLFLGFVELLLRVVCLVEVFVSDLVQAIFSMF